MRWPAPEPVRSTGLPPHSSPQGSQDGPQGRVLWCVTRQDLFAPALAQAGLTPDRVIYVEAGNEKSVLACFEEALRYRKLGAVGAEVAHLSMTAARSLQVAAEDAGAIGLPLRRCPRQAEAAACRLRRAT